MGVFHPNFHTLQTLVPSNPQARDPSPFNLAITVAIGLFAQLCLSGQRGRSILSRHDEFDQLHLLSLVELLVLEKGIQLGLCPDRIRNGDIAALGKRLQELGVLPTSMS